MKIIEELIEEISKGDEITKILIKAKVLAYKLKVSELTEWIDHELNGYPNNNDLPSYRIVPCMLFATLSNGWERVTNYPIPLQHLPSDMQKEISTIRLSQSISMLEDGLKNPDNELIHHLPPQMYHWLSHGMTEGAIMEHACRKLDQAQISQVRTAVRSKLLDLLLKLNDELPKDNPIEQNKELVKTILSSAVFGNNTVIQIGDQNNQNVRITNMVKGNFNYVEEELKKSGLDAASIKELKAIIDNDNPNHDAQKPGEKVQGWMSKVMNKAINGTWSVGVAAAGKIIADIFLTYYGWKS